MRSFCIYGKGGIGKSTVVANLAAQFAQMGLKTAVVGCDPKADSTRNLVGEKIPAVLDLFRTGRTDLPFWRDGFGGVLCIESGGPEPGTGCAGRGIIAAMAQLRKSGILNDRDVVLYDVLGDVVCGGFSMPLRERIADRVFLVTTSDYMSLYAANNICRGVKRYAQSGAVRLGGIIGNGRSSMGSPELIETFAQRIGTRLAGMIPMSSEISRAELYRKTVVEAFPESEAAQVFREIAQRLLTEDLPCIPEPMTDDEVEALCREHWGR